MRNESSWYQCQDDCIYLWDVYSEHSLAFQLWSDPGVTAMLISPYIVKIKHTTLQDLKMEISPITQQYCA